MVGAMITAETESEILEICAIEERSKSWVAAALIERGLAAYNRDGQLKEPNENGRPNTMTVPLTTATPRKKKA